MSSEQHRGARIAISCLFVMIGLLAGTWFTRIPAVMDKHDLNTGQVGFLLLCFSLGALVVFQVVGRAIARFGSSRVVTVGGVGMCAALVLLAIVPTPYLLAVVLFADGVSFGGMNVALNAKGVATEQYLGHRIMGSLHGFFTAGMLLGSIVAALVARAGVGPEPHFAVMAAIGLAILALAGGNLLPDQAPTASAEARERHVLLPRVLWPLGLMAFCASISEGAMYDWSALYVHQELGRSEATGAAAFAAFSLAVLVGRFGGDRVVDRFGPATVVRLGSSLAGAGLLSGLVIDSVAAVACGFAALGLGVSVLTPMYYSAAGSREGVSSAQGVAAVATCGMLGLLAGPPLLGNLGDATSLRLALAFVAIPCAVMIVMADNVANRTQVLPATAGASST